MSCSVSYGDLSYGQVSAVAGATTDTQSSVNYTCSWGFFEPFFVSGVRLCLHIGPGSTSYNSAPGGFRKMRNGVNVMRHDIFTNASRSTVWGSKFDNLRNARPVEVELSSSGVSIFGGSKTGSVQMYGRATTDSGLGSGTYTEIYSGTQASATYGPDDSLRNCNGTGGDLATSSFTASANLAAQCSISASDLVFGATPSTAAPINQTSTINLNCSQGAAWQVALNPGNGAGATTTTRKMTRDGGTETLNYQLYRNAGRTQLWGQSQNNDTFSGSGTGNNQSLTVYGRVPAQTTPRTGVYRDTVVATVIF